ncbi:hypothetical protein EHV15_35795 [Paenibacillus oralis]|uniref:Uncharacterized protein n=1 Tax=Paenibacillus oralis TaxID=2490856 RepID=A0A3P3TA69_9BACL|nr:hypothetical protein [Paenibacillus oralis]RRJ54936.1 hypothetical protein EHV15_35795 [Paenibacillus oralis]
MKQVTFEYGYDHTRSVHTNEELAFNILECFFKKDDLRLNYANGDVVGINMDRVMEVHITVSFANDELADVRRIKKEQESNDHPKYRLSSDDEQESGHV